MGKKDDGGIYNARKRKINAKKNSSSYVYSAKHIRAQMTKFDQ